MSTTMTGHPTLDQLHDFRIGSVHDHALAHHVANCEECQRSVAFLATLSGRLTDVAPAVPRTQLRARIVRDTPGSTASAPSARRARWWVPVGAAAAAVLAVTVWTSRPGTAEAVAGPTAGTLILSTSTPRAGERITVRYAPGATLGRFPTLRLRARVRTASAGEYTAGTPVIALTDLTRGSDGAYTGAFTLPDSIVYAALAVEDTAATEIDDRDGRTWEVLRATARGVPVMEAFRQRGGDHMGRSWETVFDAARQMVAAYPDSIAAWNYLRATQIWMGLSEDSVRVLHRASVARFDQALRATPSPSEGAMGAMYWYARGLDTAVAGHWERRLRQEAPRNSFVVQNRLIAVLTALYAQHDTTRALQDLEALWQLAPDDRREQILSYTTGLAVATRDTALVRRWTDRALADTRRPSALSSLAPMTRAVAMDFVRLPALRREGLQRLRDELRRLRTTLPPIRGLNETQAAYIARRNESARRTLAALGEALAIDGQHVPALDTLQRAAADGWDLPVLRMLRTTALAAGDTAVAIDATARLVIDPRTPDARRREYEQFGRTHAGSARWQATLAAARQRFVTRTFADMRPKAITQAIAVRSADGAATDLRAATRDTITVVAFLSRFCGPAVEVLPALRAVAADLQKSGVRTLAVLEETTPSAELTAFLQKHTLTFPVYLDHRQAASNTFNNWGTPQFYVVDARGRIMSDATNDPDELRVYVEAVRLASLAQ